MKVSSSEIKIVRQDAELKRTIAAGTDTTKKVNIAKNRDNLDIIYWISLFSGNLGQKI